MALPEIKLPPLAALVAGIRAAIAEGVAELRAVAATAPPALAKELNEAADKLESVLTSTELATIGLAAANEVHDLLTTFKSVVRHSPTDIR